jgi:hypothetical protein
MTNSKNRRSPALKRKVLEKPNLALTIARIMDAIDLGDAWVVRRADEKRGRLVVGARPLRARQPFIGWSAKTKASAAKIAKFVDAKNDGTGRVSFLRSKRLPGVEGYAECYGDRVDFSVSGISSDIACVLLETLIYVEKEKRKAKRKARR